MRISDGSSDVCSSDLGFIDRLTPAGRTLGRREEFTDLESARQYFSAKTLFRGFDPECFDAYLQHGLQQVGDRLRLRFDTARSEERRAGKECVRKSSSRRAPYH